MSAPCEHRWAGDSEAPARFRCSRCGVTAPVPMAKTPPALPSHPSEHHLQRMRTFTAPAVVLVAAVLITVGRTTLAILVLMIAAWCWLAITLLIRWQGAREVPSKGHADV